MEWSRQSELSPITEAILSANHVLVRQLLQANCSGKIPRIPITLWRRPDDRDRKLSAFMQAAVKSNAKDCASFVLGDVCCLEKLKLSKHEKKLQQLFYDLSLNPEASVYGETLGLCPPPVPLPLLRLCQVIGLCPPPVPLPLLRLCRVVGLCPPPVPLPLLRLCQVIGLCPPPVLLPLLRLCRVVGPCPPPVPLPLLRLCRVIGLCPPPVLLPLLRLCRVIGLCPPPVPLPLLRLCRVIGLCPPPVPLPLLRLCRVAIRPLLPKGPAFLTAVDQLPLPRQIRDLIAFRQ